MQIELASDPTSRPGAGLREGVLPSDVPDGGQELLDDFLDRLQSIVRKVPAAASRSLDDTRPTRAPGRRS